MKLKLRINKKILWILVSLGVILVFLVFLADLTITRATNGRVFSDTKDIPYHKVGLLLGTSKFLNSGQPNRYFKYRIKAAVDLFKSHKIDYIVISGDNSQKDYNEPEDMKNELVRLGIPAERIFLDYAGFRTFDSVIKLNKIFGQESFTVISQEFHNRRAIYIASRLNLDATGYNARDVDKYNGFKTKVREKLARVKVFMDLLFGKQPKYLGEKIIISYRLTPTV